MLKALPYTLAQLGGIVSPWKSTESRGRPKPNLSRKGLGDLFHLSKPQLQQLQNEDGAIKGPGQRPKTHTPVCIRGGGGGGGGGRKMIGTRTRKIWGLLLLFYICSLSSFVAFAILKKTQPIAANLMSFLKPHHLSLTMTQGKETEAH